MKFKGFGKADFRKKGMAGAQEAINPGIVLF
jgi:hypothetical protein